MSRLELTGLIGSNPLGALAAFGLLRVLSDYDCTSRLSFVERDDWIAVMDSSFGSEEALLAWMKAWAVERRPQVFSSFGESDVRVMPSDFHMALGSALYGETPDAELATFLVGLAADGATDKSKGLVKPTPFYMASGQQSFLDTIRRIFDITRNEDIWGEALFGPWVYGTLQWGAGWDPSTERMHALRHKAPTKDKTACVAGAVCLAFEALPLFPSFSIHGRIKTVGWVEHDFADHWRWPLPTVPTSLDSLQLLLASAEVAGAKDNDRPAAIREGIGAIYESTRHEFGQGYGVFRPARRLA